MVTPVLVAGIGLHSGWASGPAPSSTPINPELEERFVGVENPNRDRNRGHFGRRFHGAEIGPTVAAPIVHPGSEDTEEATFSTADGAGEEIRLFVLEVEGSQHCKLALPVLDSL